MARITIVGTGYVGLTTGTCLAEMGHDVCCLDIDDVRIAQLQAGEIPIYEPGLKELVLSNSAAGRLCFSGAYAEALTGAEFVFIAVGTPPLADGGGADMQYVLAAAASIARSLSSPAIIVNKSTSPIGTGDSITWILQSVRPEFGPWTVVSNPEFLREGCAVVDCLQPARVVLGASDSAAAQAVAVLYDSLDCPIIMTDLATAEMIKYASNAFLAMRISFVNEVARICDVFSADVCTVADGMGLDPRIGSSFLQAGLGYGGSCFPKDVAALVQMAASQDLHPQLLRAVMDINDDQRRWAVDQLEAGLGSLKGRTIAVWGLSFKPNTDDMREAPALDIIRALVSRGASVRAYDPVAGEDARKLGLAAAICSNATEAVKDADALLLATDWEEFTSVNWPHIANLMRGSLVFDGRNCLAPDAVITAGLRYVGVGRKQVARYAALQGETTLATTTVAG
ncbi:MAG: UDP-glucose dehydrogenase family protein [Chloroflexota bacterium]